MNDMNNEKNKSAVILNPERSEWVSRSHVTGVESVVNDGAKTKRYSAKRDLYGDFAYAQPLKMTDNSLSFLRLRGASDIVGIRNVITRRTLVRRGYLPEQGTHANKESLFASVTWLMRLPRRIQRMLLVMTIPVFALLLTLITTTESRADESATAEDTTQTQENPKILPDSGSCGNGCLYEITTDATTGKKNLRVYNDPNYTGVANIADETFAGRGINPGGIYEEFHTNANFNKITIDGDFDTIGANAFWQTKANEIAFNGNIENIGYRAFEYNNFTSISLPENLKTISGQAFYGNKISSLIIPDSVTSIGYATFNQPYATISSVQISDSLSDLGMATFRQNRINRLSIICKGEIEKCRAVAEKYNNGAAKIDLSDKVVAATEEQCNSGMYYYTGSACVKEPDVTKRTCEYERTGYIKVGDYCASPEVTYAKKHYTPAEANQWLRDGNDNFVVLTFKK